MFQQDQKLAERNQRIVSWMVVPALIFLMIAALVVPALVEPSERPPVESMFDDDATRTPTLTPTATPTPEDVNTSVPADEQRTEQHVFCTIVNADLCVTVAFTGERRAAPAALTGRSGDT